VVVKERWDVDVLIGLQLNVKDFRFFKGKSNISLVHREATPKMWGKAVGFQQTCWDGFYGEFRCFPNKEQSNGHLVMVAPEVLCFLVWVIVERQFGS
jgi:hypothetical protein